MKTNIKIFIKILLITVLYFATGCSKDDDNNTPIPVKETPKSSEKQITSFVFNSANNGVLTETITATINESSKTISATVPYGIDITAFTPAIQLSDKASVSPTGNQDFSDPVAYTVTAEDGTTTTYNVTVNITPNTEKQITSFVFSADDNDALSEDITAVIDENTNTISAIAPLGTDLTTLLPNIEISAGATITPTGTQNFTNPVTYTVTAQNGTSIDYEVTVSFSEKDVLAAIFNANPNNTLDWILTDPNISNWTGVTTNANGNIIELNLRYKGLEVLPSEIGNLANLTTLYLNGNNLTEIPTQIGNLTNLTRLDFSQNLIPNIPTEIGNLTNLTFLVIGGDNTLTEIPTQIGQLTNLEELHIVFYNQLTEIPIQIGQLTNLTFLSLRYNNLTGIPTQIGNLTNLTRLRLDSNNLSEIPTQIGNLTNLTRLQIHNNNITTIPNEVCALNIEDLQSDAGVECP